MNYRWPPTLSPVQRGGRWWIKGVLNPYNPNTEEGDPSTPNGPYRETELEDLATDIKTILYHYNLPKVRAAYKDFCSRTKRLAKAADLWYELTYDSPAPKPGVQWEAMYEEFIEHVFEVDYV